jgi:hypothetical protein
MFVFGVGFAIYERFLEDQARKSPDLDAKVLILATSLDAKVLILATSLDHQCAFLVFVEVGVVKLIRLSWHCQLMIFGPSSLDLGAKVLILATRQYLINSSWRITPTITFKSLSPILIS